VSGIPLTVEHITPKAKGGNDDDENLWLSCRLCNEKKGILIEAIDPEIGDVVSLFNPRTQTHGSLIFIEVFKIYKLLNLLKLEKLFFVGSPIVTTLGGSWAVITAVYMVLFGLNFGQNRPFFALQKSNFGFAFENERTVRLIYAIY